MHQIDLLENPKLAIFCFKAEQNNYMKVDPNSVKSAF